MKEFFTSDTHFDHTNILQYEERPFKDVKDMNKFLIDKWNSRVDKKDTVYHLGDFHMGIKWNIPTIREKLNGTIILILGNHDRSGKIMKSLGMDKCHKELTLLRNGLDIYLHHRPKDNFEGDFHLCGHVHRTMVRRGNIINVGVDVRDYEPKLLEELIYR